jgi:hypothetical protein
MEYEITANPSSPGYDYLAVGHDVPIFAKWAHEYNAWPQSMAPVRLAPVDRSV